MYRLKYTINHIIAILDNYSSVASGNFDSEQSHEPSRKSNHSAYKAPFENSIISKADVDTAIDRLGRPGLWNTYCKEIEGPPAGHNLSPLQYRIAEYIQGSNSSIRGIARELARLA